MDVFSAPFQDSGELVIQGPLRIYWGISKPIQLQQFDNVPSNQPQNSYRHSFVPGHKKPSPDVTPARKASSPTLVYAFLAQLTIVYSTFESGHITIVN